MGLTMFKGVTVTVHRPTETGRDRFNNVVYGMTGETIDNVLYYRGASEDLEAARPEGMTIDYTLSLPNTYTGSLEGCSITLPNPPGGTYDVIGEVVYLIPENTPTDWNGVVSIGRAHG